MAGPGVTYQRHSVGRHRHLCVAMPRLAHGDNGRWGHAKVLVCAWGVFMGKSLLAYR